MKTFVSNLGFDTSQLYQCLLDYGVDADDRLLLFRTASDDPRGENAVDEIERMLREVDRDVTVDIEVLDPDGYADNVATIADRLDEAEGELVVNLGGGDRAVTVALTVATTLIDTDVEHVTLLSDTTRNRTEIALPRLSLELEERECDAIETVANDDPVTIGALAEALGVADSTASRLVGRLAERRLVEVERDGRTKTVEPTALATVIAE